MRSAGFILMQGEEGKQGVEETEIRKWKVESKKLKAD